MARFCKNMCVRIKEHVNAFGYKYDKFNWCKSCSSTKPGYSSFGQIWYKKTMIICPCCKNKLRTRKK